MGPLIFSMALPAMISMIINALYNIVDSIFVAKYSQDALAAVSLVYPLQMLVVAIGVGTGVGVNSLIARRLGERRQEAADLAAEHGVALSVIGGIAFFIIGWGLSGAFVGAFGASEAVSTNAVQYSHIAVGMSIFVLISMMCEKIQQSGGNMIIPMCQGLTGAIINIILDPLMIFGIGPFPEMGIRGAALATVIGQIFGMALGLWGVFRQQKVLNQHARVQVARTDGQGHLPRRPAGHCHAERGLGYDGGHERHFDRLLADGGQRTRCVFQAADLRVHAGIRTQSGCAAGYGLQLRRTQPQASDGGVQDHADGGCRHYGAWSGAVPAAA